MQKAVWNGLGEGTSVDPFILEVNNGFDINNSFDIKIESNFMGWQNEENYFKFSNSTTVYLLALIIKDRNESKYFMTKNAIDYTFIVSDHMNINEGPFTVTSYLGVYYLLKQQIFTSSEIPEGLYVAIDELDDKINNVINDFEQEVFKINNRIDKEKLLSTNILDTNADIVFDNEVINDRRFRGWKAIGEVPHYLRKDEIGTNRIQGSALVGDEIYWIGGTLRTSYVGNAIPPLYGASNKNISYNLKTNTWKENPDLPYRKDAPTIVAVGTDIYVLGSISRTNKYGPFVSSFEPDYKYDTITNTYTNLSFIQDATYEYIIHQSSGADHLDGRIYISGRYWTRRNKVSGQIESITEGKLAIYDIATNTWEFGPTPPMSNDGGSSKIVNRKFYVYRNTLYAFDIDSNTWSGPLNVDGIESRSHTSMAAIGDKLYVIGGYISGSSPVRTSGKTYVYDTLLDIWSEDTDLNITNNFGIGIAYLMAVVWNGKLVIYGGTGKDETVYGPETDIENQFPNFNVYIEDYRLEKDITFIYDKSNQELDAHIEDLDNPHGVTAEQVPLNGSGTNYLVSKTDVESAVKELDHVIYNMDSNSASKYNFVDFSEGMNGFNIDTDCNEQTIYINLSSIDLGTYPSDYNDGGFLIQTWQIGGDERKAQTLFNPYNGKIYTRVEIGYDEEDNPLWGEWKDHYGERSAFIQYQSSSGWAKIAQVRLPINNSQRESITFLVTAEDNTSTTAERYTGILELNTHENASSSALKWLVVSGFGLNNFNLRLNGNSLEVWVLPTVGTMSFAVLSETMSGQDVRFVELFDVAESATRTGTSLGYSEKLTIMTNAEIKAAYEANANTNAYTDADKAKVDVIDIDGDGSRYLADDGEYYEVSGSSIDLNEMAYFDYAGSIYGAKYSLLASAWEHSLTVNTNEISVDSLTSYARGSAQYPDRNAEGIIIPRGVTSIGNNAFRNNSNNNMPLVIPNSVTSIGSVAFSGWTSNNQPLIIPDSVTSIGQQAFEIWTSNNQPLVISNSITSIESYTFQNWILNNHPLIIPDSVTSIGSRAFQLWRSNNHPLVIPDSVTSIGSNAFNDWSSVPYIEMKSTTPPTLANANAFGNQNDAPIYVPDASVDDYKTATNWINLASRIFPVSDKDNTGAVTSVNGEQGDVVLNQDDIGDGVTYKQVSQAEKNTWNDKQDKLVAGDNINIVGNTISASGGLPDAPDNDFYVRTMNSWYRLIYSSNNVIDINSGSAIRALMNNNDALMYTNLDMTNYKLFKVFGSTNHGLGIFAQYVDLTTGQEYQMANVQMVVADTADPIWVKIEDITDNFYTKGEIDTMIGDIESLLGGI